MSRKDSYLTPLVYPMNRIRKQGNLHLIVNSYSESARPALEEKMMQPLSSMNTADRVIVFMRESELQKKGAFAEFAKKYSPRCVVDMRTAPRLDLFAGTRLLAFKLFNEMQMDYFDFFGRAGIYSKENIENLSIHLAEALKSFEMRPDSSHRPLVLFFDNDELLKRCKLEIDGALVKCFRSSSINIAEYKSGFLSFQRVGI